MLSRSRSIFLLLSILTLSPIVGSTLLAATSGDDKDEGEDSFYKYLSVFTEVLSLVDRAYVDETEMEKLMIGAFEGAADALDPFSLYVPATAVESYEASRAIGSRHSGLLVLKERGVAYAASIEESSPAAEAGVERGDIIAMIDGEETREMPLFQIHTQLAGPAGTVVKLETIRMGVKNELELTLQDYSPPGVELRVEDGIAVMRLPSFHAETAANVGASLTALQAGEGLDGLSANDKLIIDLRGVAGGEESVAYQVASLFVDGELGVLTNRGEVVETFTAQDTPRFSGEAVLLVDRGTQGPAEVLAKVLQDRLETPLVGMPTFGHSGRLSLLRLSNGGRLQLTDSFYTGPDREPIVDSLEPDFIVPPLPPADDEVEPDAVLEKGLAVVRGEAEPAEEKQAA